MPASAKGSRARAAAAVLGLAAIAACNPVAVQPNQTTMAPISVPGGDSTAVNILAIGVLNPDGSFNPRLRASGFAVTRGSNVMIAVVGPGMITGTRVGVVGTGFVSVPAEFGQVTGGTFDGQPVAVFSMTIPQTAQPGIYSVIAGRGTQFAVLAGALEVQ